jgi:hypothetical protein
MDANVVKTSPIHARIAQILLSTPFQRGRSLVSVGFLRKRLVLIAFPVSNDFTIQYLAKGTYISTVYNRALQKSNSLKPYTKE